MKQLDLLAPPSPPPAAETDWFARLERYITRGQPGRLELGMTVCQMHQLWDDLWYRGDRAHRLYSRLADRCAQIKPADRHARERLKRLRLAAYERAACAKGIPESLFLGAQEQLTAELQLDDDLSEMFWQDIGDRPGIEHTWSMTLQAVLDWLRAHDHFPKPLQQEQTPNHETLQPS